jgi:hypothetical protein
MRQRLDELHMTQTSLSEIADVSKQIVGELVRNSEQRDRSDKILAALSRTLRWHSHHLAAIRDGETPPGPNEPEAISDKDIPGRLAALEHNQRITNKLLAILIQSMTKDRRLDEIAPEWQAIVEQALPDPHPPRTD